LRSVDVVEALHARELPADVLPMFPGARPSAVLVALRDGPHGAEVLLTRRSMHMRNHRGEISFPGGRLDAGETYEEAALREAAEEVALPATSIEVVGRLLPLSTVVSLSYIVPVVGLMRDDPELHAATSEVDRLFWEPLADLLVDGTYREERWGTPPLDRPIFFFELEDETVWGATARMLHQLLRVAHRVVGPEPDAI
jgi:8-oxo-dGTP pyrophosphatase MutT (NUDIX family)